MSMTVCKLMHLLQNLDKAGYGNFDICFHCEPVQEILKDGTGVRMTQERTFTFADDKYEFKWNRATLKDGYQCDTIITSSNINIDEDGNTVTIHQDETNSGTVFRNRR